MKAAIYYFSGTGNTKYVGELMKVQLEHLNYEVEFRGIDALNSENSKDKTAQINVENLDLLIIGGPIYAGNVPEKLIRWVLRQVPETTDCEAIVYTTSAGLKNANGTTSLGDKLIKKGYSLKNMFTYEMPRNYYFDNYEPTPKEVAKQEINYVREQVGKDIIDMQSHKPMSIQEKVLKYDLFEELMSVMTRFMGKNYEVSKKCIQCGLCEKSCPTQNIKLEDKKKFKLNCMMCTRCLHSCPVNAITYKKKTLEQYNIKEYMN